MTTATSTRFRNQAKICAELVFAIAQMAFRDGVPVDRQLAKFFRANRQFGAADRRFVSNTMYSVFRWWGWLRALIGNPDEFWSLAPGGAGVSIPWLKVLLGAYRLDALEPHPAVAVWEQSIGATTRLHERDDSLQSASLPEKARALSRLLGIRQADRRELLPDWFIVETTCTGPDLDRLIDMVQRRPPLWLRIQKGDPDAVIAELRNQGFAIHRCDYLPNAAAMDNPRLNVFDLPQFREGKFEIQDFASQVIGHVCQAKPGDRWWDVCAGAGGKSLQLASEMRNRGAVIATDIREWKLADLKKRARRGGFSNISPRSYNGAGLPTRAGTLDGVLVDAPCSCSGTWRRNPDARWTSRAKDLDELTTLQYDILRNASRAVGSGGTLVYATCSLCVRENEGVVEKFLASRTGFVLDSFLHPIDRVLASGMIYVMPWAANSDAAFICRMRRE